MNREKIKESRAVGKLFKRYSRDERKLMIVRAFITDIQKGNVGQLALSEIARALQVTASSKLRDMIREMEIDGVVKVIKVDDTGIAGYRYIYRLTEASLRPMLTLAKRKAGQTKHHMRINNRNVPLWEGEL
jgi:DNA-binding HxlR family transcriptional regulator